MKESIDALGFVVYLFSDVMPYTVRELASLALTNPLALGAVVLVLWIVYKTVSIALHYGRVLAILGAGYALVVILQRYVLARQTITPGRRGRWLLATAASLSLFLVLLSACAPAIYPATTWSFINEHRASDGLSRFEWDDSLLPTLNERAQHLAVNLELNHDGLQEAYEVSPAYGRDVCEIGGKQPLDALPDSVGFGIIESPPHHACLDDPKYTRGVIAAWVGADGWVYEVLWITN